MNWLYLFINLASISVPLLFSFHPRIRFYEKFRTFIPAMLISAAVYLSWDIVFTRNGVWGFNAAYLVGVDLAGLPIEEWLFFICIPFASVFTHYTLTKIYPAIRLHESTTLYITWVLIALILLVSSINIDKAYTAFNGYLTVIILLLTAIKRFEILQRFYLTFLVVLIPFFIVNGTLTGSFIPNEVVWYNNEENLGIRLFTIPVEDIFYALGMLLLSVFLTEAFSGERKTSEMKIIAG